MKSKSLMRCMLLALAFISLCFMMSAGQSFAAVGGSDVPTVPSPVFVGQTGVPFSFTIINGSTTPNDVNNVKVFTFFFTTACGSTVNPTIPCPAGQTETNVIVISPLTATGQAGTACAGKTFTVAPTGNPSEYQFTPNSDVILGPSNPGGLLASCKVNFTVNIVNPPTHDSSAGAGLQTSQLARTVNDINAGMQDTTTLEFGGAQGSSTLTFVNPEFTVNKTGPDLSKRGDSVTYNYSITNTGGVVLNLVSVIDDKAGTLTVAANTAGCNVLSLAETCNFTANYTVQQSDPDPVVNTVTVTYNVLGTAFNKIHTDDHSIDLLQPAIDVTKTCDTMSKIGDTVNYTITLSNNSSADTPALICTAVDSLLGTVFGPAVLPFGNTVLNQSRVVQPGDPDPLVNTVTLTCSPQGFPNVLQASDTCQTNLVQPTPPSTPTSLGLSQITGGFRISWDNVSGATSYQIYWGNDSSVSETNYAGIINEDISPSDHTGLVNGYTYYYRIRACNSAGCSGLSDIVYATYQEITQGYASVSQGVTISPDPVTLGQNFSVSFTLKEINGAPVTFEQIVVAILRSDDSLLFDIPVSNNVTIPANGTQSFSSTGQIYTGNPTGQYKAMIRGKVAGGNWFNFSFTGSGVNPGILTAVSAPTSYFISGRITYNGAGLSNVTMTLSGDASQTTYTAPDGTYSFTGLADGLYTVTPNLDGYIFDPPFRDITVSGGNVTGQDFIATAIDIDSDSDGLTDLEEQQIGTDPHNPDTDEDALSDGWEVKGIDIDQNDKVIVCTDGSPDLPLAAMGANPRHKDIFVEIDYMEDKGKCVLDHCFFGHSHEPNEDALKKVIEAFANAPVDDNPDKIPGIHLHIDAGPDSIMISDPETKWGDLSESNKVDHHNVFGCINEKGEFDLVNCLPEGDDTVALADYVIKNPNNFSKKRAPVFRYCIFVHTIAGRPGGATAQETQFFVVADEELKDQPIKAEAGTFMHELGHTLGLSPAADTRYPNYLSVMNYRFQLSGLRVKKGNGDFQDGDIDYSRFDLPPLNEKSLREKDGLNNGFEVTDIVGGITKTYGTRYSCKEESFGGTKFVIKVDDDVEAIDWNCKNGEEEDPVEADITYNGKFEEISGEDLESFNDWKHLIYAKGVIGKAQFGVGYELPSETEIKEIPIEELKALPIDYAVSVNGPGPVGICPGTLVNYTFGVKNTGELPDTYLINGSSSQGWADLTMLPTTVSLNPDEEVNYVVPIQVPFTADTGEKDKLKIIAVSNTNENLLDSDIVTSEVLGGDACESSSILTLVLPNGGDVLPSGGTYGICWEAPVSVVKFDLKYSTDNGTSWNFIKSVTGLNCTHWEEVPAVTANKKKCRVKVIGYDSQGIKVGEDISDKPFTIEVLRITSPNGGETLKSGDTATIQWVTHKTIRPVAKTTLKYTTDGTNWKTIKTLTGNPGTYNWKVPVESSTKCKVKVILKDASGANIGTDISDKVFTIQP